MALVSWLVYLAVHFFLLPAVFRLRYGRSCWAVPLIPRCRYDLFEHLYGLLVAGFTMSLFFAHFRTTTALLPGLALMVAGSAIIAWAVWTLGPHWRIGQDASDSSCQYVRAGPYRLIEHPIYVGMTISAVGHCLAFRSLPGLMLVAGTAIYCLIQRSSERNRWRSTDRLSNAPGMIRYVILVPLAWAVGVATYLAGLYMIWGQTVGGDLAAVMIWSLLAVTIAFPTAYVPVLSGLRRLLGGYRPLFAFPLAGALVGILPTAWILFTWGGGFRALVSPEAGLFFLLFGALGLVLGVGFAWPRRVSN